MVLVNLCGSRHRLSCSSGDGYPGHFDEWGLPEGRKQVEVKERRYVPSELIQMFTQAGLKVEHIRGGTAGNWKRRQIDLDEIEIMVVASKE